VLAELTESQEDIPPEYRSKPKTKDELARIHSGSSQGNPSLYLKRQKVTLLGKPNSKLWIADLRDFDSTAREKLLS